MGDNENVEVFPPPALPELKDGWKYTQFVVNENGNSYCVLHRIDPLGVMHLEWGCGSNQRASAQAAIAAIEKGRG